MDDSWGSREALISEIVQLRKKVEELEVRPDTVNRSEPGSANLPKPMPSQFAGRPGTLYTQEQLMTILDSLPSGVEIVDASDGRLSFVNKRGRELHGDDIADTDNKAHLETKQIFRMDGSPYPLDELPINRSLETGETFHDVEFVVQQPNGQKMVFLVSSAPLRDEQGRIVAAVVGFLDITRRKATEVALNEALQVAETRTLELNAIINSVPDSLIIYNVDERPIFANEAARQLSNRFQFKVGDDISQKAIQSYTEDGRRIEPDKTPLRRALRHGETIKDFIVRNSPDKTATTYATLSCAPIRDSRGCITGAIALLRDITETKAIQAALRESEKRYREIVKYAPAGIYEIDYRTQRFLTVNDSMCDITGYSRAELLAMNPMALMNEEGRQLFQTRIQQYLSGGIPEPVVDYKIRAKDGREIDAALVTTFTTDNTGKPVGATVIAIDITERKKLEEALRQKAEELAQADKNKNLFLHTLSHELRNPLATIVLSLDLLTHIADDSEPVARVIRILKRQTGHLTHLVDDLLDVTRITTNKIQLKKQPIELVELLRRSITDYQRQLESKGISFETDLPDTRVMLEADPVRLQQAVGNLLHNALKFTPAGGQVHLSARQDQETSAWFITVEDTGSGIEPDILPQLFEPFSQADQSLARDFGGLGLGLSIVKGIVELHGGTIDGYSEGCGKGARFTIHLPV